MRSPSSWSRVLRLTYAAVLPLYFACGLLGYAAYGDFANANINVNFPDNLANQASIVVQMVQEVRFLRSTRPRHHAHLTPHPHLHHSPLTTHHSPLNLHQVGVLVKQLTKAVDCIPSYIQRCSMMWVLVPPIGHQVS